MFKFIFGIIVGFMIFKFDWIDVNGSSQLIARSGYSRQGGFEIYLRVKLMQTFYGIKFGKRDNHIK